MSFNSNKLNFKIDDISGEIIQPKLFLCDRKLNKKGEIYPFSNLRIKSVLNGADEISFTIHKDVTVYSQLKDYSVILAEGFGYFEVSPTTNDTYTTTKNVQGSSLGEMELSQLHCTLECNTDDDMIRDDYDKEYPTVLYRNPDDASTQQLKKKYCDSSLIHRILTYAPNYSVGTVDETIQNIQRTFRFENSDIISCFSQIAEEINCIFDVVVRRNDDGEIDRIVNIYDAQYCNHCHKRNIINGICQDCGSSDIAGIGEDTTILISTDNLSDEITLTPDGNMKNCFLLEGGDDLVTDTVKGIMPSDNGKIYLFSPETMSSFSDELKKKYKEYKTNYDLAKDHYADLLETQYNIFDLILYLQSGRMPNVENAEMELHDEVDAVITKYQNYFPTGLGLSSLTDTSSRNSVVRQIFALFVDNGYAVKQENGNYDPKTQKWTGDIIVYQIKNNDSKATVHVHENSSIIEYSDTGGNTILNNFFIQFSADYETYMKQMIALETETYEYIDEEGMNQPKKWQMYSLNQLNSYSSGYNTCILALEELKKTSTLPDAESKSDEMIEEYNKRISEISEYTKRLEDMIYHLYSYLGIYDHSGSYVPSSLNINYSPSSYDKESMVFKTTDAAFQNMVHYIRYGTWAGENESENTDHPLYCIDCNSANVTLNGCNHCQSTNIITYSAIARSIYDSYIQNNTNIEEQRTKISETCDLKKYLGDILYKEFMSYVREDIYTNSNFISDGLGNSELILKTKELVQKAEQELAKACISQHTLSGNVYAFVAHRSLDKKDFPIENAYDKFKLGNFMRYISEDGDTYKLRLSSEEFNWTDNGAELNVEFTDVIHYLGGSISDIASLMQAFNSLSTSFDSVKKQAEQGQEASKIFSDIKADGLYSSLGNVLNARDIDVQIDDWGITLRKYDYELGDYSPCQMKLINRNIVMTEDNWKSAKLAIGLGHYDNALRYGIWADVLVGNVIAGEQLKISNKNGSVEITGDGINIKNGSISWEHVNSPKISEINDLSHSLNTISSTADTAQQKAVSAYKLAEAANTYTNEEISKLDEKVIKYLTCGGTTTLDENYMISPYIGGGYLNIGDNNKRVIIDPANKTGNGYIFQIHNDTSGDKGIVMGVKSNGDAVFKGEITATSGKIGGWNINHNGWLYGSDGTAGISWEIPNGSEGDGSPPNKFNLNGENMEMTRSDTGEVKLRINTHTDNLNDGNNNCMTGRFGYINLSSGGRLRLTGEEGIYVNDHRMKNWETVDIERNSITINSNGATDIPYSFDSAVNILGCILINAWPLENWNNGAIVSISQQIISLQDIVVRLATTSSQKYNITLRIIYSYL